MSDDDLKKSIADSLRRIRKASGYTSAASFCEKLGIDVKRYYEYEAGRINIPLSLAFRFCDVLGCSLDELAGRKDQPGKPLTDGEEELVGYYDACDVESRRIISSTARRLASMGGGDE